MFLQASATVHPRYTGCGIKKQPPKKNSIYRKPCNLNSWNSHHIILRNTTVFSENFFHIIHMKQKLQLSELKKDNFATAHTASLAQDGLSRNCPQFIRKEEWPPNSPDLNPLDYRVGCDAWQVSTLRTEANEHFGAEDRPEGDLVWLATRPNWWSSTVISQKASGMH